MRVGFRSVPVTPFRDANASGTTTTLFSRPCLSDPYLSDPCLSAPVYHSCSPWYKRVREVVEILYNVCLLGSMECRDPVIHIFCLAL